MWKLAAMLNSITPHRKPLTTMISRPVATWSWESSRRACKKSLHSLKDCRRSISNRRKRETREAYRSLCISFHWRRLRAADGWLWHRSPPFHQPQREFRRIRFIDKINHFLETLYPFRVVDFVFTELENMLTDYNGAKEILSKCHRQYPLRGFDDADIYYLEASFYHIKRAINRRAVLLKQLLIDSKPGDETKWNDPEQLLTFIDRFEQKYFDFVIAPVDKEVYNVIDKLGNNLRVVVEGHHLEGRVRVRRNLVGNKVWRLRAQALCDQRHHLSDIWREEFWKRKTLYFHSIEIEKTVT